MSASNDDLLQTIVSIALAGAERSHISHEFARAVSEGEAEMESEFEADDQVTTVTCKDCDGEIRGADPEDQGVIVCTQCAGPDLWDEYGGAL